MKILIEMNLPPRWAKVFAAEGWEALHWSQVGTPTASDREIMAWARDNDYIVFTHDLDFSALLAATQGEGPSAIQVRTQNVLPEAIGTLVINAIKQLGYALHSRTYYMLCCTPPMIELPVTGSMETAC